MKTKVKTFSSYSHHVPSKDFEYSITISNKGVKRYFPQLREDFMTIDLSSNKFEGNIPEFLGNLKGLCSCNISNDILTGSIPQSLGNLTLLESLDLSQFSGQIPEQLTQLTFLAEFNVSYNNLSGLIPQGTQFATFGITSYEGNFGLCGDPFPRKCGDAKVLQLPRSSSAGVFEFDWKFIVAGVVSGFIVGVVLTDVAITRRQELFIEITGQIRTMIRKTESWVEFDS